jgi:multidrug efflux pump subunit AcrA (membrane-fusion protein)
MRRSANRIKSIHWLGIVAGAAVILLWVRMSHGSLPRTGPGTDLGEVVRGDLTQEVTVAGTVQPLRRSLITPPYNAYVKTLFVHVGQRVKAGDPLITLAQSLRGGAEDLFPMRAPFEGVVVQVLHNEGEYVETGKDGNGLVRVDDMSKKLVISDVPESNIDKIRVGQDVRIKVNPILDRQFHGVIREIALAALEKKDYGRSDVEFEVRMELLDATPQVDMGMSTIVDIITDRRTDVLTLPHEYIEKHKDKYFATLEDGERREIQVGLQNEDKFEIKSGLKENERVKKVDFASLPVEED